MVEHIPMDDYFLATDRLCRRIEEPLQRAQKGCEMKEFELFVRNLFFILSLLFAISFFVSGFLTDWNFQFLFSFTLGYTLMVFDYIFLIGFSRRLPEQVTVNYFPGTGFFWRYILIASFLIGISVFTPLNFFAIISAVAVTNIGLILSVAKHYKEWRKWNTEQS